ncbi:cytochrome C [Dyadobacter psychrotolerans]|uniref:Cytochrome C n=1 Tax=Dyadobacter psychrotolerans TaxID=2541721 RepID=A0A4R5D745_9BACT|nr:cytochrome C [Dyadobacter psychrotolerans]TDE09216.1 cytochrome C [Dyadobacter psychrotolerans]
MEYKSKVYIFLDDQIVPVGEFETPVRFELDTRKLVDGKHTLKIVGKDPVGNEGIKHIPFIVRNGPAIAIEGLKDNDIIDGIQPIMINAYGKGNQTQFLIDGSETPTSIPSWLWAGLIVFFGWAIYYVLTS